MRLSNVVLIDDSGVIVVRPGECHRVTAPACMRVEPAFVFSECELSLHIEGNQATQVISRKVTRDTIAIFFELLIPDANKANVIIAVDGQTILAITVYASTICSRSEGMAFTERRESNFVQSRNFLQSLPFSEMLIYARQCLDRAGSRLILVTGSVGKTTTKELIASLISPDFKTAISTDSWNYPHEICSQIAANASWAEVFVMEAALNRHMRQMGDILRPDILVVSNIGHAHTSFSTSVADIARQKLLLACHMPVGGTIVYDHSQQFVREIIEKEFGDLKKRVNFVSVSTHDSPDGDIRLTGTRTGVWLKDGTSGAKRRFKDCGQKIPLVSIGSAYAVYKTLGGRGLKRFAAGIASFSGVPKRLEVSQYGSIKFVNDAYNANPISMSRFLGYLDNERSEGRKVIAIIGEMLDLGELSSASHSEVFRHAVASCDHVIFCGRSFRAHQSSDATGKVRYIDEPGEEAIFQELRGRMEGAVTIGVKGSSATGMLYVAVALQERLSTLTRIDCE